MKKKKNGAMHTILGNKIDYDTYKTSKQVTKVMYEKNLTKFNFTFYNKTEEHAQSYVLRF